MGSELDITFKVIDFREEPMRWRRGSMHEAVAGQSAADAWLASAAPRKVGLMEASLRIIVVRRTAPRQRRIEAATISGSATR